MDNSLKLLLIAVIGFFILFWVFQNYSSFSFKTGNTFTIGIVIIALIVLYVFLNRNK